jgi:tetratricopeptide (TPR) repeat protein
MAKQKAVIAKALEPEKLNPQSASEFLARAWLYYSRGKFDLAVQDFTRATEAASDNPETWYGLGLAHKSSGATSKAVEAFQNALNLIGGIQEHKRASIFSRLVKGQINQLKTGDWNLEKEVWHTVR